MELRHFDLDTPFQSDARKLRLARDEARAMHASGDIKAAGNHMEAPLREVLAERLSQQYEIAHGHIVDYSGSVSPQIDVIVADRLSSRALFQGKDGTEYVPYESVYAVGEVKTTYEKSNEPIQAFSGTISRIQALRRQKTRRNPLFSFMFFADSGKFAFEDVEEFYRTSALELLPCMVFFLDAGIVFHARTARNDLGGTMPVEYHLNPSIDAQSSGENHWNFIRWRDVGGHGSVNLMFLEVALIQHLRSCELTAPNLFAYLARYFQIDSGEFF